MQQAWFSYRIEIGGFFMEISHPCRFVFQAHTYVSRCFEGDWACPTISVEKIGRNEHLRKMEKIHQRHSTEISFNTKGVISYKNINLNYLTTYVIAKRHSHVKSR